MTCNQGYFSALRGTRRGFSLVELSVVAAILLLLALLAIGSYVNFATARRVRSGAEEVNSVFTTARAYAIASNKWHRVVFQMRNPLNAGEEVYSYWIDEIAPNSSGTPNAPQPGLASGILRPKVTTPEALPQEIRLAAIYVDNGDTATTYTSAANQAVVVRFRPDGSSDGALVSLIDRQHATTDEARYYQVKVYAPTGKSKIFPSAVKN